MNGAWDTRLTCNHLKICVLCHLQYTKALNKAKPTSTYPITLLNCKLTLD